MKVKRRYRQFCALALALDVVGERWTLLVVRELLLGSRRYSELLLALPGIGTNLLAARLKELHEAGLVQRSGDAYELTGRGRELEPVALALARWGMDAMEGPSADDRRQAGWYAFAMQAAFRPEAARGVRESYELRVDDDVFHLEAADGVAHAGRGPARAPSAVLTAGLDSFLELVTGTLSPSAALNTGRVALAGERAALDRLIEMFGLPPTVPS
jgi:DNA-binding HxlR family transcriptional regulator/putative sterol carrier protein